MGSCSGAAVWDSFLFNPAPARQGVATARLQMAPGPLGPGKASSNTRRTTLRGEQATHLSFIQRNWLLHRCKTWCERHIGIGCGWTATIWFFHSSHWEIWAAPSKHPSRASGVTTILTFHLSQKQTATRCSTRLTQPLAHAQAGFLKSAYYINLERNRCRGTDGDPCLMDLKKFSCLDTCGSSALSRLQGPPGWLTQLHQQVQAKALHKSRCWCVAVWSTVIKANPTQNET